MPNRFDTDPAYRRSVVNFFTASDEALRHADVLAARSADEISPEELTAAFNGLMGALGQTTKQDLINAVGFTRDVLETAASIPAGVTPTEL